MLTAGLVLVIPVTVRAIDGIASEHADRDVIEAGVGLGCLVFGVTVLILRGFDTSGWSAVLPAVVLGVAGAIVAPELVQLMERRADHPPDHSAD